jgi:hypothetical protein
VERWKNKPPAVERLQLGQNGDRARPIVTAACNDYSALALIDQRDAELSGAAPTIAKMIAFSRVLA